MDVIATEGVSRRYGETVALDGVSLSVAAGEVFALVGPNGAGKTTLVRALTGTTDSEGRVELFGDPPRECDRERIGLLPQNFSPPDRLTPRELVAYYGGLYDHARPADELLDAVGVTGQADTYYENLSGGEQRRTCVATALVNDPDLLVLDEPTTGVDPAGRRTLWRLLDGLAEAGTTIFFTTHYMAEAEQLADRVGLLADGSLAAVDTPAQLVAEYGGETLLRIEGAIPAEIADHLSQEATVTDGLLTVRNVAPESIGEITRMLDEHSVTYESLTWREPDLEDVYLELTGQSLPGDAATAESSDAPESRERNERATAKGGEPR
jgi:ABC-2 type transport system ATP-binding protein